MSEQHVVKCRKCKLVQFVKIPDRPAPKIIFPEILPTAAQWEMMLIEEAIRRTGNKKAAAKMIGIGTTTVYRKATV